MEGQLVGGGVRFPHYVCDDHESLRLAVGRHYGVHEDDLFDINDPDWEPLGSDQPPLSTEPVKLLEMDGVTVQLGLSSADYLTLMHSSTWEVRAFSGVVLQYPSEAPMLFPRDALTLSFRGPRIDTRAEARRVLDQLGGAIGFQFDVNVRPDAPLSLARCRGANSAALLHRDRPYGIYEQAYLYGIEDRSRLQMPDVEFNLDQEALSLYWAARTAAANPLYQFIAYYQVLEHFFPRFSVSGKVREEFRRRLLSGRLDPQQDRDLDEIIGLAQKSRPGERELLRSAIRVWVQPEELCALLQRAPRRWSSDFALAVEQTELSATSHDERTRLADRLYGVRCRIVHTKSAGEVPPILPASQEAEWLDYDIQLAEFVAQKALRWHCDSGDSGRP